MSLVSLKELLETANKNNFAVGYFEAWDLYSLEAVALAAEKENSPIVLGFGGMTVNQEWINSFGIEPLGRYANELAKSLSVPAAVYLNEVYEIDHAKRGIKSGFNSVLLETSNLSYEENVNTTRELVKFAHSNDAHVQGEVGHLPDFIEDNDSDKLTDPNKAKNFINYMNIIKNQKMKKILISPVSTNAYFTNVKNVNIYFLNIILILKNYIQNNI